MASKSAGYWTRTKRLGFAAFVAMALYLVVGLPVFHSYLVFFPARQPVEVRPNTALPLEEIEFATSDGLRIAGWLAQHQKAKGTIILCHGSGANRLQMLGFAEMLFDGGYSVLMFDYRGNGNSGGYGTSFGYNEVRDFDAAVAYVNSRTDLSHVPIGALGISMGAGVVLVGASGNPQVKAVVADSVFSRLGEVIHRMTDLWLRAAPIRIPEGRVVLGLGNLYWRGDLADFRPVDAIAKISPRAVMLIHSADDNQNTTVSDAEELYGVAGEPKYLWIAPRGGHVGAAVAFPEEYRRRVLEFFERYLQQ